MNLVTELSSRVPIHKQALSVQSSCIFPLLVKPYALEMSVGYSRRFFSITQLRVEQEGEAPEPPDARICQFAH